MSSGIIKGIDAQAGIEMAWHGLTDIRTSEELQAFYAGNPLDHKVEMVPHLREGKQVFVYDKKGNKQMMFDVLVGGVCVNVTSGKYPTIQNAELFSTLSILWEEFGFKATSMFSIFGRSRFGMSLESEDSTFTVGKNDNVKIILGFVTSHNKSIKTQAFQTLCRMVCANTVRVALDSQIEQLFSFRKSMKFREDKLPQIRNIVSTWAANRLEIQEHCNTLYSSPMAATDFLSFTVGLLGESKLSSTTFNKSNKIAELMKTGIGNNGETRWDALNGVTEYFDHHAGKDEYKRKVSAEWGTASTQKAQAFDALLSDEQLDLICAKGEKLIKQYEKSLVA